MLDQAKWIWRKQDNPGPYNQTVVFRKTFPADAIESAQIAITADTRFRLVVNGDWVNDGPCRSWPEHFQYDVLDLTPHIREGANTIEATVRYFGCGTFHQLPEQAGFLAQLNIKLNDGSTQTIATDETWEVAEAPAWVRDTPKQSIQMGPFEVYDARGERTGQWSSLLLNETV